MKRTSTNIIDDYRKHVSSGKVSFYQKYGLDFVPGLRETVWQWDIEHTKRLFNLHCNGGVFNLGHRNPEVVAALISALEERDIGNHHFISQERAALGRQIADTMPGDLDVVIFGVSGGEAVDLSLKLARGITRRSKVISAVGGYHGHTGLALAAGEAKFKQPFNFDSPDFIQVPFGDIAALRDALTTDIAAVILETIPATAGMLMPPPGYLSEVQQWCNSNGALLILDEVQSGLGRTGRLWAFEGHDVIPDMVIIGKGLSGGIYPITATVIRKPLNKLFEENPFAHISTFGGSELGCRVGMTVMDMTARPDFLEHVHLLAEKFAAGLNELRSRHASFFTGFRQDGLMLGLQLTNETSGLLLSKCAFDNDLLIVFAGNDESVCQLLPPLVMELEQVDWVIERLDRAMSSARKRLPIANVLVGASKLGGKISSIFSGGD